MKIWKKINKGLLLTIIVLIVLIIYLKGVEKQREADKTAIKTSCEEYINLIDNLMVLPEDMQNLSEENEQKIQDNINNELKKVMIDNEDALELQSQYILEIIKESNKNKKITNCKKSIDKISNYEFDGDQVVVKFSSNLETSYKYVNAETNEEEEKQNIQSTSGDEITLQKVEGQWKIVYSYLDYYQRSSDLYLY